MAAPTRPGAPRERHGLSRRGLVAAAGVLVIALAGGLLLLLPGSGQQPRPTAAATPTWSTAPKETPPPADPGTPVTLPTSAAASVPSAVLATVPGLPSKLPPVALGATTDFGDGVTARLVGIKAFNARGVGVGEFSGPALAVTVELTNGSTKDVSLATASVNLFAGPQGMRATPVHDAGSAPFSGRLAAGASARATYAFGVPVDQRGVVTVTVGTSPQTGTAVFAGPVS